MADTKLTALGAVATLAPTDIVYVVDDPGGTPVSGKATVAQIVGDFTHAVVNVDNLRLDGNTLSSTSGNIAVTAAAGGTLTLNNGDGAATVFGYNFSALGGDNFSLHQDFGFRLRSTYVVNWFDSTVAAGSADVGLARNAAGALRVTDGSTGIGSTLSKRLVEAHTTGDTLTAEESRSLHTNAGAGAGVTLVLPAAAAGLEFHFYVAAAQNLVVDAGAGDVIQIAASASSAGGTATNATIGGYLAIVAIDDTNWVSMGTPTGTWTLA